MWSNLILEVLYCKPQGLKNRRSAARLAFLVSRLQSVVKLEREAQTIVCVNLNPKP